MLLGVIGPHATGKSTYHKHLVELYRDGTVLPAFPLQVILADNGFVYTKEEDFKVDWTKAKKPEKEPYIENMVADDTTIYIVESARFFGGLAGFVYEKYLKYNGGARFILASVTTSRMLENMSNRCKKVGKKFQEEYWIEGAKYENRDRYLNQLVKQTPTMPWIEFDVPTYETWMLDVHPEMVRILSLPYEEWYN